MSNRIFSRIERRPHLQLLLLTAITFLAAGLRFYKLGAWSFWGDEWITVRRATSEYVGLVDLPSISMIATHFALEFLGIGEWSARAAPAVLGLLTIPILFFITRALFDSTAAIVAGLLLAISPWHLYWSQNARFYTALLLFFTLALFFFYLGLERDRPLFLLISLLFLGLAIKERHLAAFLGPISFLYVLLIYALPFDKPAGFRARNLLLFFGPGVVAAAGLAYSNLVLNAERWDNAFAFINNNPFWILGGTVFYITIPLACAGAFAALYLLREKNRAGLLLTLTVAVPLFGVLFLSLFQYTANRYVFISLTSIIILAAICMKEVLVRVPAESRLLAYGAVLILILAPLGDDFLYFQYQNGNRADWQGAFNLIRTQAEPNDRVATTHSGLADFYLQKSTNSMQYLEDNMEQIEAMEAGQERIWFVLDLTAPAKTPKLNRWVQKHAQLVAQRDVTVSARTFPMRIYLYEGMGAQDTATTSP